MAKDFSTANDKVAAAVQARPRSIDEAVASGRFVVQAHRNGELLWEEDGPNLIVDAGLTYLIGSALLSVTPVTTWYVVPIQAASSPSSTLPTIAAGDTMASHAGWAEVTAYDEATRQAWTGVAGAAGVATNSASPAVFTCSTNDTYFGGIVLAPASAKSATTAPMFSGKAFGAVRTLQDNDTLTVTYQPSVTAS